MPPTPPRSTIKVQTSITLEPEVLDHLTRLALAEERTRSEVISRIVRRDALRHGTDLLAQRVSKSSFSR
jgi:hypothetical protein